MVLRKFAFVLALATGACAQAGALGDVLGGVLNSPGGFGSANVVGEVQRIDTRNQAIEVRTNQGQTGVVYYDSRTRVIYNNQEYSPTSLEAGDVITMRVQETQNQEYYTDYIEVQQSVQDRSGSGSGSTTDNRLYQLEGTVQGIDYNRGYFYLRAGNNSTITVTMPYNPVTTVRSRFERLRNGDFVRLEGYYLSNDRVEVYRFN